MLTRGLLTLRPRRLLIGLFEASVVVALAVLWFGVLLTGSLLVLYSGILLFLPAAVGVGLTTLMSAAWLFRHRMA